MRAVLASLVLLTACRGGEAPRDETPPPAKPEQVEPTPEPREPTAVERKQACLRDHVEGARARDQALLRSLCADWIEREIPGVALAIVEPDAEPVHVELGVRCSGEDAPITPATSFRLGSVTKTLTASLALGLVAEGELALDDGVGTHLPAFEAPRGLSDPKLGDLLGHVSGLGEISPDELVALDGAWLSALACSSAGTPGEFRYSNAGYALVGALLGAVSSRGYVELIADELANPLALTSLTADPTRAATPACGHLDHDPARPLSVRDDLDFMPGDPSWMTPAGGALSSATDLARLALILGTPRLPGTDAMLEALGTPVPAERANPRRRDERYGYGLRSWLLADGTRAYGHSGDNVAFRAELMFVPGRRAIVLLANRGTELTASVTAAESLLEAP